MSCVGATNQNVKIHTGDSALIKVLFVDCDGAPIDIRGATLTYTIRKQLADPHTTLISPSDDVQIADDGLSATFEISSSNTNYNDEHHSHELVITDLMGHRLTVLVGRVIFTSVDVSSCGDLVARVNAGLFVAGGSEMYLFDFSNINGSAYAVLL